MTSSRTIRLHMVVEGRTEEIFARTVLAPHLAERDVFLRARRVTTRRRRGIRAARGGMVKYHHLRRDLTTWGKEDRSPDVRFTTMVDLYALPEDFPEFGETVREPDLFRRVERLERALADDLADSRLVPYVQLHEFEALVLVDPTKLASSYPNRELAIARLVDLSEAVDSPEEIDDGAETAPSKRIIQQIPRYADEKSRVGPLTVQAIGLPKLRERCPHFDAWITKLESLAEEDA